MDSFITPVSLAVPAQKNKGRISRFLANKCSIASRIDNFSEAPSTKFGEALKRQVEDRLEFYASGKAPMRNEEAMKGAMDAVLKDIQIPNPSAVDADMADITPRAIQKQEKKSKDKKDKSKSKEEKKDKKRRHSEVNGAATAEGEKKKKKKSKDIEA